MSEPRPPFQGARGVLAAGVVATLVVAAAVLAPTSSGSPAATVVEVRGAPAPSLETTTPHVAHDGHAHDHNDPAAKNAISRSGEQSAQTADPTTPEEAATSRQYVAAARAEAVAPEQVDAPIDRPRLDVPEDRYAMAGGCYAVAGHPVFFQATDLGSYLLYTPDERFVARHGIADEPSPQTVWEVSGADGSFRFASGDVWLAEADGGFTTSPRPTSLEVRLASGCTPYPEVEVNVAGAPFAGATSFQEVRGYADPHTHGMTHEFLGGRVICSPPWHPYGAPYALVDCPDHQAAGGRGALLEDFLAGNPPGTGHDPVGWPTFEYWPNPHSLTHQMVYYKWLERAWRGGLRVYTNLLTENNVLCELYPLKKNSCDDRDAVRLQAQRTRQMQDYIDAQYGGPGRGWFRIVTDPFQAREVINSGRLAVVIGIETSVTLGCNTRAGIPTCTEQEMVAELEAMRDLGVSQMEITNKFDNAFTGVAGDSGSVGPLTNFGNFLNTGSFLRMKRCPKSFAPGVEDKEQTPNLGDLNGSSELPAQDAIFGGILELFGGTIQPAPVYPDGPHCNQRGLTSLGESLMDHMQRLDIMFDPDHMSVIGRKGALDHAERMAAEGRPIGLISSHSWSTPDAYPRIYEMGGFIAPYAGDSAGFVDKWRQHLEWADERYYFGFGYGADMNGFGTQGDPRGADAPNPVTYPFTGLGGTSVERQVSGERVYDINIDGVSHYGLYPDWIEDVQHVAEHTAPGDGAAIVADLARGAEAYLQTWERAHGIAPDSCRNPDLRLSVGEVRQRIRRGMTTEEVMRSVGQPFVRSGHRYVVCATAAGGTEKRIDITFDDAGRVARVSS